jgi:hypothetical protein
MHYMGMRSRFVKFALLFVLLLLGTIPSLSAGHLLIRTDGSSQWVRNLKSANDRVTATDESSGETMDLDKSVVAAAIPVAQHGTAYPLSEVSNVLARIAQIQPRFPKLKKQLNQLKQEWEPFLKSDATLAEAVEKAAAVFRASPHANSDWKTVQSTLEMIKYHDVRSEYKSRIDELLLAFHGEYFETNRIRLLHLSTQCVVRIETFLQARQLKDDLISAQPAEAQKAEIMGTFELCRSNVFQQVARSAQSGFKANPTLAGYLSNAALLYDLHDEVTSSPTLKDKVTREIFNWQTLLQKTNPGLTFEFDGYPFEGEDRRLTEQAQRHMPLFNMQIPNSQEDCFLVPLQIPTRMNRISAGTLKARAIFKRKPPMNRRYVLVLLIHPESGPQAFRRCLELPGFNALSGRSGFEVTVNLSTLPSDFRPVRQDDGSVYLIIFLAEIPADLPTEDLDETLIKPRSKGWGLPVSL